jgi:hypothetical protein
MLCDVELARRSKEIKLGHIIGVGGYFKRRGTNEGIGLCRFDYLRNIRTQILLVVRKEELRLFLDWYLIRIHVRRSSISSHGALFIR